jgi:CheY-like chemotaxis protein
MFEAKTINEPVPRAADEKASDDAQLVDHRAPRGLVVDDCPDNRILLAAFLKKAGWQIDQAENGEEAVRKVVAGKYDVVLMDIQMPIMDGYDAVRQIRQWERVSRAPRTPIIALTAYVLNDAVNKSIEAGCDIHLGKPVQCPALLATIHDVIARNQRVHSDVTGGESSHLIPHRTSADESRMGAVIRNKTFSRIQ